MTDRNEDDD